MRQLEGSWIANYMAYTTETECPIAYHLWLACFVIGVAVGRNVWLERYPYTVTPNLYVLLVGPSAVGKSTAARMAMDLLVSTEERPGVIRDRITPEALVDTLATFERMVEGVDELSIMNVTPGVIYATELATMLSQSQFLRDLIPLLTRLHDDETFEYTTRRGGIIRLHNPCIGFLGCCTPVWLKQALSVEAMEGGFAGRMNFVLAHKPEKLLDDPQVTPETLVLKEKLINDLNHIQKLRGPMTLTEGFKKVWSDWYYDFYDIEKVDERSPMKGHTGRRKAILHKLAMIASLAEGDSLELTERHFKFALSTVQVLDAGIEEIVESMTSDPVSQDALYIHTQLNKTPVTTRRELSRRISWKMNVKRMDQALQDLYSRGLVELDPYNVQTIILKKKEV